MIDGVEQLVSELKNEGHKIKRTGREYVMPCPFHSETKPSLYLNSESGLWHCFGCDQRGDLFKLARKLGKRVSGEKRYLLGSNEEHVYEPKVESGTDEILNYLMTNRRYSSEQATNVINRYVLRRVQFGKDVFAHMPIKDFEGTDIGWIMRLVRGPSEEEGRRYFLKKGFPVKRYFYGEWLIEKSVKSVAVVEGAFDLFRVWSAGYPVLASLGFSVPNEKLARLVKHAESLETIVLFFDSDVKDKDVQMWLYYAELFQKKAVYIPLRSAKDPDQCTDEMIRSLLQ